jgi:hypothetical protein
MPERTEQGSPGPPTLLHSLSTPKGRRPITALPNRPFRNAGLFTVTSYRSCTTALICPPGGRRHSILARQGNRAAASIYVVVRVSVTEPSRGTRRDHKLKDTYQAPTGALLSIGRRMERWRSWQSWPELASHMGHIHVRHGDGGDEQWYKRWHRRQEVPSCYSLCFTCATLSPSQSFIQS